MKNKPTITYIENGVEKTINLNFFNKGRTLNKISEKLTDENYLFKFSDKCYTIKKSIEFIHFKNCKFIDFKTFKTSSINTLCIFEDCTFSNKDDYSIPDVSFIDGTYELINPVFEGIYSIQNSSLDHAAKEIIIKYQNSPNKIISDEEKLRINSHYKIGKLDIEGSQNFCHIVIYGGNTKLTKNHELDTLGMYNKKTEIGNKETDTNIKTYNCNIESDEKVNLTNCTIEAKNIKITSPEIETENVTLKSPKTIKINDTLYFCDKQDGVIVTDKDIARANLISALKGYKNKLDNQISLQTDIYLAPEYKQQQEIEEKIEKKSSAITKSLSRKK